ncbi:Microtubule-associated protein 1B [Channa argus]|uniref:Microtubule-associated protein 1B n=1 Tax=Channa argus TaxID=215402 RepID=A0A6G1PE24_CHAAH|nr:Microtubule-associated protein 1B [Channa argus]
MSAHSTPEDLTKDFEELKKDEAIAVSAELPDSTEAESETTELEQPNEQEITSEIPAGTTSPEVEAVPAEVEDKEKVLIQQRELEEAQKFEDEGAATQDEEEEEEEEEVPAAGKKTVDDEEEDMGIGEDEDESKWKEAKVDSGLDRKHEIEEMEKSEIFLAKAVTKEDHDMTPSEVEQKAKEDYEEEEEEEAVEKAELEEVEDLDVIADEEIKVNPEDAAEEQMVTERTVEILNTGKEEEEEEEGYLSHVGGPTAPITSVVQGAAAAEPMSYIQDETIPGYSETEQTISDEEIHEEAEERIPHLQYDVGAYDISVPDQTGSFVNIHGMREMQAAAMTEKGFIPGIQEQVSVFTNIITAPLAEEEHVSSATSITEYDKMSSFPPSITEDQSVASVTAPPAEEPPKTPTPVSTPPDVTQSKEQPLSAGTLSPPSLEDDKQSKSPSDDLQFPAAEVKTVPKAPEAHDAEEEEEEDDEDQTPNVDISLEKLQEGYASSQILQGNEKDIEKILGSVSPVLKSVQDTKPVSLPVEEQIIDAPKDFSSVMPTRPFGSDSVTSESEERCFSPDDITVKMASPPQSGPSSAAHSPIRQSPVEDKMKLFPDLEQQMKHELPAVVTTTEDKTEQKDETEKHKDVDMTRADPDKVEVATSLDIKEVPVMKEPEKPAPLEPKAEVKKADTMPVVASSLKEVQPLVSGQVSPSISGQQDRDIKTHGLEEKQPKVAVTGIFPEKETLYPDDDTDMKGDDDYDSYDKSAVKIVKAEHDKEKDDTSDLKQITAEDKLKSVTEEEVSAIKSITDEKAEKVAVKDICSDITSIKEEKIEKDTVTVDESVKDEQKVPEKDHAPEVKPTKEAEMEIVAKQIKDEHKQSDTEKHDFDLKIKSEVKEMGVAMDDVTQKRDSFDISPLHTEEEETKKPLTTDMQTVKDQTEKEAKKDDVFTEHTKAEETTKEMEKPDKKEEKEMEKTDVSASKLFTDEKGEKDKETGDITLDKLTKAEETISKDDTSDVTIKGENGQKICTVTVGLTTVEEKELTVTKDEILTVKSTTEQEISKEDISDTKPSREQDNEVTLRKDDVDTFKSTTEDIKKEDTGKVDASATKLPKPEEKDQLPENASAVKAGAEKDKEEIKACDAAIKLTQMAEEHVMAYKDDYVYTPTKAEVKETPEDPVKPEEERETVVKPIKMEEEDLRISTVTTFKDETSMKGDILFAKPMVQDEKVREMCAVKTAIEEEKDKVVAKEETFTVELSRKEEDVTIQEDSVDIKPLKEETDTVTLKEETLDTRPTKEEESKEADEEKKRELKEVASDVKLIKEEAKESQIVETCDKEVKVKEQEVVKDKEKSDIPMKEQKGKDKEGDRTDISKEQSLKQEAEELENRGFSDYKAILEETSDREPEKVDVKKEKESDPSAELPKDTKEKEPSKVETVDKEMKDRADVGGDEATSIKQEQEKEIYSPTRSTKDEQKVKDDYPSKFESKEGDKQEGDLPVVHTLEKETTKKDICDVTDKHVHEEVLDKVPGAQKERETSDVASVEMQKDSASTEVQTPAKDDICVSSQKIQEEKKEQDKEAKVIISQEEKMEKEKDDAHVAELSKEQKMEKEQEKEYTYGTEDTKDEKTKLEGDEQRIEEKHVTDTKTEDTVDKEKYDSSDADHSKEEKWEREELQEKDLDKTIKQPPQTATEVKSDYKPAFVVQSSDEDKDDEEEEEEEICMGGAGSRPLSVELRKSDHDISSADLPVYPTVEASDQTKPPSTSKQTTVIIPTLTMQEPSIDEEFGKEESKLSPETDTDVKPEATPAPLTKPQPSFDIVPPMMEPASVPKQEPVHDIPTAKAEPVLGSDEKKPALSTVSSTESQPKSCTLSSTEIHSSVEEPPQEKQTSPGVKEKTEPEEKPGKEAEREMEGEREVASPGLSQRCSYFMLDKDSEDASHTYAVKPDTATLGSGEEMSLEKETVSESLPDEKQTFGASKYEPYEKPIPKDHDLDLTEESELSLSFDQASHIGIDDNRRTSQTEAAGAMFFLDEQYKEEPLSFSRVDYSPVCLTQSERSSHRSPSPQFEDREKGQEEESERERPDTPYVDKSFSSIDMQDNKMSQAVESYSCSPKEDKPEKSEREKEAVKDGAAAAFPTGATEESEKVSTSARSAGPSVRQETPSVSHLGAKPSAPVEPVGEFTEKKTWDKEKEKSAESLRDKMESPDSPCGRHSPAEKDILPQQASPLPGEEASAGLRTSPADTFLGREIDDNALALDNSHVSSSPTFKSTIDESLIDKRLLVEGEDFNVDEDDEDEDEEEEEEEEESSDIDMEKGAREQSEKETCRLSSDDEGEDSNKKAQLPESRVLEVETVSKPTPDDASASEITETIKQDTSKKTLSPETKSLKDDDTAGERDVSKLLETEKDDVGKTTVSPGALKMDPSSFPKPDTPKHPETEKGQDTDKKHLSPEPTTERRLSSADITPSEVPESKKEDDKTSLSPSFSTKETCQPASTRGLTGSPSAPDHSESKHPSSASPPLTSSYADIGMSRSGDFSEHFDTEETEEELREDRKETITHCDTRDDHYFSQRDLQEDERHIAKHESACTYTTLTYATSAYSSTTYSYSSSASLRQKPAEKVEHFTMKSASEVSLVKEEPRVTTASTSSCFGGFQRDEYMEVTTKPATKPSLPTECEEAKPSPAALSTTAEQAEVETGSTKPGPDTKLSTDSFYMLETKITTSTTSLQSTQPEKVSECSSTAEARFDVSPLQRADSSERKSQESAEDEEPEMEDSTLPCRIECQKTKVAEQQETFSSITESQVVESTVTISSTAAISKSDVQTVQKTETSSSDSGAGKTSCAKTPEEIKEKTLEAEKEKRSGEIAPLKKDAKVAEKEVEDEKTEATKDTEVKQKIAEKKPEEKTGKDSTEEKKATADLKMCEKVEVRKEKEAEEVEKTLLETPPDRLEVRRKSSISDWELLQRPDDCPSAPPPGYGDDDAEEEEEAMEAMEWMASVHGTSVSSSKDAYHSETAGQEGLPRPSDLSTGATSSSASPPGYSSCEYKHRKGELSPSFINPSPHQLSSDEDEEDGQSEHSQDGDGDGDEDDQDQHSVKRRSHKHRHHHAQSYHGDAGHGSQQLPGGMSSGLAVTLAGEETPPTSVSESLPSQSDSDVPPETEECPSITAEGNLDSDEDAEHLPVDKLSVSGAGGGHHPPSPRSAQKTHDPLPMPMKDPLPHPPHPDVCMVDPEALLNDHSSTEKLLKKEHKTAKGLRKGKPKSASPARKGEVRKRSSTPVKQTKDSPSPRSASLRRKDTERSSRLIKMSETQGSRSEILNPGKGLVNGIKNSSGNNSQKTSSAVPPGPPVYVDLAYVPNHCSAKNVDQEFFKRVRAAYYVVSGNDPGSGEPSRGVLDALLEGKAQWGSNLQVTLIPTHDTEVTREWYQQTHERQQDLNIMVLASSSTVVMQDESFPACKIEF